jgi:muramoyltetrapeptide carboxypeptidase LdcA involved in peptidoglycan recycling
MIKPKPLHRGDKVAIVSLSSGNLGEAKNKHQLDLGIQRLHELDLVPVIMNNSLKGVQYLYDHPEARAADLKQAYLDPSIKGIICSLGGDETYRLLPYLMEDSSFLEHVRTHPKIFTGFSDTTNNHLFFYRLGVTSYYGPNFMSDLADLSETMLPYTKQAFKQFFAREEKYSILSSPIWYEERTDFSARSLGLPRVSHPETRGYEVLYGSGQVEGALLGGCLESLYDGYTGHRYPEQKEMYEHYHLMPTLEEWEGKIMFFETSEEHPTPDLYRTYLEEFAKRGILSRVRALLVGKPQNECYYEEYKEILCEYGKRFSLPILYNVNFGHGYPRTVLPYGLQAHIDFNEKTIHIVESFFSKN